MLRDDAFHDRITGNGAENQLAGGAGNDTIDGGAGSDYLFGNAGQDRLRGGAGDDVLKGNAGGDVFVYDAAQSGHDVILDFTVGTDRLNVKAGLASAAALLAGTTADADGNAVLHLAADTSITLIGVNPDELTANAIQMI